MNTPIIRKGETITIVPGEDCVIYRCKLTDCRVFELILPVKLPREDVERLYALMKSQMDDQAPPQLPRRIRDETWSDS